ncbi:LamG domain-containing protein [Actinomadura fibrosa]|uniref:LamG-like jellyroll fold domain-containing protein n=1 Tax=Actinomadura fibrosa TaxID=111802 RepID=A0ABW2XT99_9ACTN|nr:LamG domain-containing protein [Actinomadura fibrosa]
MRVNGAPRARGLGATALVGAAALLITTGTAGLADGRAEGAAPPSPSPASAQSAPTSAERAALARARASGKRVEVVAKRTETMEVYAEPGGHFTAAVHPGPVRVRRDGGWVPVDTTLVRRPDGSVAPRAAAVSLAFSGGGQAPLVRLGRDGGNAALRWPGRLPEPVIAGATAVYPDVLPGVDLKLTAGPAGFGEVLVVKTRTAARNPRLRKLRFGVDTSGLTLKAGRDGGSDLVGAGGETVFSSPAPAMWDAASNDAVGRFEVAKKAISVVPDQKLLTGRTTRFPVSIDPDWWAPMGGWAKVFRGKPGSSFWNGGGDVEPPGRFGGQNLGKVGQCWNDGTCNGIQAARTYVQFDIRALHGAQIITPGGSSGAEFNAHEVYAPACSAPAGRDVAVDLLHVNAFDGGLTWGGQQQSFPAPIGGPRAEMHGHDPGGACGPSNIGWGVGDAVRWANDRSWDLVSFMLRANNEEEQYGWKKFDGYSLLVHYNWPPNPPSKLSWSAGTATRPCSTDPGAPDYASNDAGPITLRSTATDPDHDDLWTRFEWWDRGGGMLNSTSPGPLHDGSEFTGVIPQGTFEHGRRLSWRTRSADVWANGPWAPQTGSQMCQLDIDNEAPGTPSVTDPPETPTVGAPVAFTATAGEGDSDVAEFRYGLSQGGTECRTSASVPADELGGKAAFQVTPMKAEPWDVWVTAVDRAGNVSKDCRHLRFDVRPGRQAVAHWPLDGRWSDTAVPDAAGGHDGTVALGATRWTRGRIGDALRFDGTAGSHVAPGGGAAVRTDQSFSVSAWVKLDRADGTSRTAVSQVGNRMPAFSLGYFGDLGVFGFQMAARDADDGEMVRITANAPPQAGVWTHLTGVYDVASHQMFLYVNGLYRGGVLLRGESVKMTTPWASGEIRIGRSKVRGADAENWLGAIDDVRIHDRALSDVASLEPGESAPRSEVDRLASPPAEEASYALDEGSDGTAGPAGDGSGNYRTVTLSGATRVPGKVGAGAVRFAGGGEGLTAGPAVRTDSSFTVAALVKTEQLGDTSGVAVSQDGGLHNGFALGYRYAAGSQRWTFDLFGKPDDDHTSITSAIPGGDDVAPVQGQWTALAAVHDAQKREVRLYVNGALAARGFYVAPVQGSASGPLVLGRGKRNGEPTGRWLGSVDEVHVYGGVLSEPEIAGLSGQTRPRPDSPFAGTFAQFNGNDGAGRYTGSGPIPPGYHFEGTRGFTAPADAPNTRPIYSCRYNRGFFLDLTANCANHEVLGPAGRLYTTPPAGVPTAPVYRCVDLASGDHYLSHRDDCESTPDKVRTEGLLGYVRTLTPLIRYRGPDGRHWTSTHGQFLPADHQVEKVLGYVLLGNAGGASSGLRMCEGEGSDEFLSTDPGCEGARDMGAWPSGWLWPEAPDGMETRRLYACRGDDGERFESADRFCEGAAAPGRPLGHVVARP